MAAITKVFAVALLAVFALVHTVSAIHGHSHTHLSNHLGHHFGYEIEHGHHGHFHGSSYPHGYGGFGAPGYHIGGGHYDHHY